jgi:dimethylamine monooxygenase subunit C
MLVTGIKSKPIYSPLKADARGRFHLMLGLGVGEVALLRVLRELKATDAKALGATRVLLVPADGSDTSNPSTTSNASNTRSASSASGAGTTAAGNAPRAALESQREIESLPLQEVRVFPAVDPLLAELRSTLADAFMGTRLYLAGPESFIGLAMKIALEFNLNKDEVRAEELGTLARRVYCIHCRATTENVRTNIVQCVECDKWLLVRDHYSRRLAAYMGVMVDAEAPGERPPIKEVFI